MDRVVPGAGALKPLLALVALLGAAVVMSGCAARAGSPSLAAAGDVAFGRVQGDRIATIDGSVELEAVEALRVAAVAFANLESPLCDRTPPSFADGRPQLVAPTSAARRLVELGVDVVSVANNHALDCGPAGLDESLAALGAAGIGVAGAAPIGDAGDTWVGRVEGRTVAVLAATLVSPTPERLRGSRGRIALVSSRDAQDLLSGRVAALRSELGAAAFLAVSLHWGAELRAGPGDAQRRLAAALIEAGADAVLGHGAHVAQEVERVGDGVVAYNLGNLVFDMRGPLVGGVVATLGIEAGGVLGEVRVVPRAEAGEPDLVAGPGSNQREGRILHR